MHEHSCITQESTLDESFFKEGNRLRNKWCTAAINFKLWCGVHWDNRNDISSATSRRTESNIQITEKLPIHF
jgi:hypothetical protein